MAICCSLIKRLTQTEIVHRRAGIGRAEFDLLVAQTRSSPRTTGNLPVDNAVLITADSVSMISEAAATVKRVHVIDLNGGSGEFDRFHEAMRAAGITRPFSDRIESSSSWVPNDTARAGAAPRGLVLGR